MSGRRGKRNAELVIKSRREAARKMVEQSCTQVENLLTTEDKDELELSVVILKEKAKRLFDLDQEFFPLLADGDDDDGLSLEVEVARSENYREAVTRLQHRASKVKVDQMDESRCDIQSSRSSVTHHYANLPKLELPTFDGNCLRWRTFWDHFEAAVHNLELPAVRKFAYLSASLRGAAAEAIRGTPITAANYATVVAELKRRFGNPNLLIGLHANQLVSTATVADNDVSAFRRLIDTFDASLREIEQLIGEVREGAAADGVHDLLLAPLLLQKLPPTARLEWQRKNPDAIKRYNLSQLREFVRSEVETLESIRSSQPTKPRHEQDQHSKSSSVAKWPKSATAAFRTGASESPPFVKVWDLPMHERLAAAKNRGLCFNCLGKHNVANCGSKHSCNVCKQRHHTCLHELAPATKSTTPQQGSQASLNCKASITSQSRVLLQTAIVFIKTHNGLQVKARALIDSGSELSYVTAAMADKLLMPVVEERYFAIESFGASVSRAEHRQRIQVSMRGRYEETFHTAKLWKVGMLCNPVRGLLPSDKFDTLPLAFQGFQLAESFDADELPIDVVLGADCVPALFKQVAPVRAAGLSAWSTLFGWVLSGRVRGENSGHVLSNHCRVASTSQFAGNHDPRIFWDLELLGIAPNEEKLSTNFAKPSWDGERYEVRLPWIDESRPSLSRDQAVQRNSSFHRLKPERKEHYLGVLDEWRTMGIVEDAKDFGGSFLPHHSVVQGKKLRVVIDGSAESWSGPSTNSCLKTGPNLSLDLAAVLTRFRFHKHAMAADIEKAFLMVGINSADRDFLKILHPNGRSMRFTRVPFGLTCSSALLHLTIEHHLEQNPCEETKKILNGLYVDDILLGAEAPHQLEQVRLSAKETFKNAGMNLRKFATSCSELRETWCPGVQRVSTLGLIWDLEDDSLSIPIKPIFTELPVTTKRQLMSAAAKIFDPFGFATPFTVRSRLLVQQTWQDGLDFDEHLPDDVTNSFRDLQHEAFVVGSIAFPRHLKLAARAELHVFSDASIKAYATCAYLKLGDGASDLVFSRARVAPSQPKNMTIPRLELMAALLSIRALQHLRKCFSGFADIPVHFYTDSMVVIGWLKGEPKDVFVRNRAREILDSSQPSDWFHVTTADNPADLPTRGMSAEELKGSKLWWHGPSFLRRAREAEATTAVNPPTLASLTAAEQEDHGPILPVHRWSSWAKAVHVSAWIHRFIGNCRSIERSTGPLKPEELQDGRAALIKDAQRQIKISDLPSGLHPERGTDHPNLILCQPRTGESALPYLPPGSTLFPLLCRHVHGQLLYHQGLNSTVAELQRCFVVPRLRQQVKKTIGSCVACRKVQGRAFTSAEGFLPDYRTTPSRPFAHTGMDHAGPLYLRDGSKAWILLFTCAVTRAVHLEAVSALDERDTSLAMRRFFALRGPASLYSDNGKSFICLKKHLKKTVKWTTIPEGSPWWGGFWERMVGTVKRALRATLHHNGLNLTELATVLSELSERINRRPITTSLDENEEALTPAHFIYGCSPPRLLDDVAQSLEVGSVSINRRWRHKLMVSQHLWKRWKSEYLATLGRWRGRQKDHHCPMVGEVVLVNARPLPRARWPLAKIVRLLPGRDGEVRAAELLIGRHHTRRALSLLHRLEVRPGGSGPVGDRTISKGESVESAVQV